MKNQPFTLFILLAFTLGACSHSKNFSREFYTGNSEILHSIQQRFRSHYQERPFAIEIKDKAFEQVGLEIITDSIRYIYSFYLDDPALRDTMRKYNFDIPFMDSLIADMRRAHCTWLTNLDYFENLQKRHLVFLSIRHHRLESLFKKDKYFTLAFFNSPQPFDDRGRLLDRSNRKQPRKINGAVFFRMNDSVAFAISNDFR